MTARQIDDTDEYVLVTGKAINVAIQIPGMVGYTITDARRLHRCPKGARPFVRKDL